MKKISALAGIIGLAGFLILSLVSVEAAAESQGANASFDLPKEDQELLDSLVMDPVKKSSSPATDLSTLPFDTRLLDKEPSPEKETLLTLDQCMSILPKAAQGWEDLTEEMRRRSVSQPS